MSRALQEALLVILLQETDLFTDTKGEWYFGNPGLKAKGFSEFKSRWGNRSNVDNWRRQQAISSGGKSGPTVGIGGKENVDVNAADTAEITYELLLSRLPITQEQLRASDSIIKRALLENGKVFNENLSDYQTSIETYEELLRRFPNAEQKEETLFALIYLYSKVNDAAKMEAAKQQLLREFPKSKYTDIIKQAATGNLPKTDAATKKYEQIYSLFLEGKFDEAIAEKKNADNQYDKSYWTPQLLFIEAIYYIKQKQDSTAINRLTSIKTNFANSPLAEKATTMIEVLKRRSQIETYLTNLDITKKEDEPVKRVELNDKQLAIKPADIQKDVTGINTPATTNKVIPKSIDSSIIKPAIPNNTKSVFSFIATEPQYVVVVLEKVDELYITEVRNAFNRFNREKFYNKKIDLNTQKLDDNISLFLMGPFTDAASAVDYVDNTKPSTAGRILPWLDQSKYSYLIISKANLDLLKENKDLQAYKNLIRQSLPGKF
jgi:outer membrane protein assembly factor BamD (BamD/ComL family)